MKNSGNTSTVFINSFDNLGKIIFSKKVNSNIFNPAFFQNYVVNSKNEIYVIGFSNGKNIMLDNFSLGKKNNFFLAKLSFQFPISNSKPSYTIFPNPAIDKLGIQSKDFKILKIKIFDAIGKLMLENNISGFANNFQISVSHLAPGTYFMQASSALETSIQKFLIQ